MIDRFGHALAHEEDVQVAAPQRGNVVVRRDNRAGEIGPQRFNVLHPSLLVSPGPRR